MTKMFAESRWFVNDAVSSAETIPWVIWSRRDMRCETICGRYLSPRVCISSWSEMEAGTRWNVVRWRSQENIWCKMRIISHPASVIQASSHLQHQGVGGLGLVLGNDPVLDRITWPKMMSLHQIIPHWYTAKLIKGEPATRNQLKPKYISAHHCLKFSSIQRFEVKC